MSKDFLNNFKRLSAKDFIGLFTGFIFEENKRHVSEVEVSPSTVIELKDFSTASFKTMFKIFEDNRENNELSFQFVYFYVLF